MNDKSDDEILKKEIINGEIGNLKCVICETCINKLKGQGLPAPSQTLGAQGGQQLLRGCGCCQCDNISWPFWF